MRRFDGLGVGICLHPADNDALNKMAMLPKDEDIEIRVVRERSLPQLRLFWQVLDHVANNSKYESAEKLLAALKVRLGRYDIVQLFDGRRVVAPQSIAFARMEQGEFQRFMDEALKVICDEVLGGYDPDRLIREAEGWREAVG